MSAEPGAPNADWLLAAIADPAVVVAEGDVVVAWNSAAADRLHLRDDSRGRPLAELVGALANAGRRVRLADGRTETLLVWSFDEDGLGPDDLALEKADLLGRLAGGISHDVANSLGAILTYARFMASEAGVPNDLQTASQLLEDDADRTLRIIRTLLEFTRFLPPVTQEVPVGSVVKDVMALIAYPLAKVDLRVTVPDSLPAVTVERTVLHQALLAILINAIEAMGGRWGRGAPQAEGRLRISGKALDDLGGQRIRLAIEDGAPVVPEADRALIFTGTGAPRSGRDLSVARALVVRAGGRIAYEPVADGNRVVVELPVAGTTLQAPPPVGLRPAAPPRIVTPEGQAPALVLVCDDDAVIRALLVRMIEKAGLKALEARDGHEAVEVLIREDVSLIVADQRMGEITGTELFGIATARRPELATRFLLTSGDPGSTEITEFVEQTGVPVVAKPFDYGRLIAIVRQTLEA